jgi:hypothetical protein
MKRIEELLKDDAAGDPMSDLKWSHKTPERIANELSAEGISVCEKTVAKLMKSLKFALRTCRKKIMSGGKPKPGYREERNLQFEKIKRQRQRFKKTRLPIISVDSKKKELIGNFKNNGCTWRRDPHDVLDHDFRSDASCLVVPSGIYDVEKNRGMIVLGTSRDTPAFAVDSVVTWWKEVGKKTYREANEILILCDSGGGNSARSKVWKRDLQIKFCNPFGLNVTICHYPPGASKWNPIEHRYFSQISRNWQGVPLTDVETALNYIRTTKTNTGLTSRAVVNQTTYEKGQTVSDDQMNSLRISHHRELPQWNYTIKPQNLT